MIYKRVPLYYIRTKLHSISTKVIPSRTFGKALAYSNPRIQILLFLDYEQAWQLKTV